MESLRRSGMANTLAMLDLDDQSTENAAFSQVVTALASDTRTDEISEIAWVAERVRRQDQDQYDTRIATEALAIILRRNTEEPLEIACNFLSADDYRQQLALLDAIKTAQRASARLAETAIPLLAHPLLFEEVLGLLSFGAKEMKPLAKAVYARLPEYMGRSAVMYGPRFESAARMLSSWFRATNDFSTLIQGLRASDPIERACAINLLGQQGAPLHNFHTHLENGLYDPTSRIVLREICRVYSQKPTLARAHQPRLMQIAQVRDIAGALALDAVASLSPGLPTTLAAVLNWSEPSPAVGARDISESEAIETDEELLIGQIVCRALMRLSGAQRHTVFPIIRQIATDFRSEVRLACAQALQYAPYFSDIFPLLEEFLTDNVMVARAALISASKFGPDFYGWLTDRDARSIQACAGSVRPVEIDSPAILDLISQFKQHR